MGRASRRKTERRQSSMTAGTRPHWAGARGFDKTYRMAERYLDVARRMRDVADVPLKDAPDDIAAALAGLSDREIQERYEHAQRQVAAHDARRDVLRFQRDMVERQYGTLLAAERLHGKLDEARPALEADPGDDPDRLPGRPADIRSSDGFLGYAEALAAIAQSNLDAMRHATPLVFDPLLTPAADPAAVDGLVLPFPTVVADFLMPSGMSMPVQASGGEEWWVGLVSATVSQANEGDPIDVWPTVTTLRHDHADDKQVPRELIFGRIRLGGPLPPPPRGLAAIHLPDADAHAWVVDIEHAEPWTRLWLLAPALAALSAIRLLDAINVTLAPVTLPRADRRRAEREGASPALSVIIAPSRHQTTATTPSHHVDWQHRWTVRGHWKHYGETTQLARANPGRIVDTPTHGRCVKVWCPPFVKGPADKPLVLKTRVVKSSTAKDTATQPTTVA